ncbi:MAG TPA: transposase [Thermomicrobiales bacterium]|nr:transposase [Thermomicrobiales bacterium]
MDLNDAGQLVTYVWLETLRHFPAVTLDAFVMMPDHMHAILTIGDGSAPASMPTLGNVVQRFKSLTTVLYGKGVRLGIYPPYETRLWQFRYHDHIIRDTDDLASHRRYIESNPLRWAERMATDGPPSLTGDPVNRGM